MPCNERICFSASLSAGRPAFGCRRYSEENPLCDLKFLSSAKAYRPTPRQRQFMPSSVSFFVKQAASNVEYSSGFGLVSMGFKQSRVDQPRFDLTKYVPITLVIRNLIEPSRRGMVSLARQLNTFGSNYAAWGDHDGASNDVFQLANVDRRTVR